MPIVRRTKAPLKAAPVVESASSGCADTFRISHGGDAQPNEDGAEAVPDVLARSIDEEAAGSGVVTDDLVSSVGFIREVGDSANCREMLKDIERVVHDDDDAGSAEAHDNVAESAKFTLKSDGTEFAGPQSVEHQALHLPRVRGCLGCDHGKALYQSKHWLEMKNGSKAHGIAARALLITNGVCGRPPVEAQVGLGSGSCAP